MTENQIDLAVYSELQETTGPDFVVELVDTFLEEAVGMLSDLREARADNDANRFRQAAHSLKSNASIFGVTALATQARALELEGLDDDPSRDEVALTQLEATFASAAAALMALRSGPAQ
jgi:HPt (histidine-containing phosphotransfer) domain-containing protein